MAGNAAHEYLGPSEEIVLKGKVGRTWDCSCGRRGSTILLNDRKMFEKWRRHYEGRVAKGEI